MNNQPTHSMDRYMVMSALAAAAIHGGVLLGWPDGKVPSKPVQKPVGKTEFIVVRPIEEITPMEVDSAAGRSGVPDLVIPSQGEPTPTAVAPDFPMTVVPTPAVDGPSIDKIPRELPGVLGGEGVKPGGVIFSLDSLDKAPRTRMQSQPVYPYSAKREGTTGTVKVEFTVDEAGHVLDPRIVDTTNPVFNEATLQAVSKWRFEPGMRHGKAVRFKMMVPIVFNLD